MATSLDTAIEQDRKQRAALGARNTFHSRRIEHVYVLSAGNLASQPRTLPPMSLNRVMLKLFSATNEEWSASLLMPITSAPAFLNCPRSLWNVQASLVQPGVLSLG